MGCRGDAVTRARHPFYAPLPDELVERGGDGGVAESGAFSDAGLGERDVGFGEDVEDAPFGGFGRRGGIGGFHPAEAQRGPLAVIGEFDLDVVEAGGGAVLDGHDDLLVAAAQVQVRIAPGVHPRRHDPPHDRKPIEQPDRLAIKYREHTQG